MSFNRNSPIPLGNSPAENRGEAAIAYFRQGFIAEAYLLLSQLESEKYLAAQFALGLCHIQIEELDAAISHLEKSPHLIKALPSYRRNRMRTVKQQSVWQRNK